MTADLHLLRLEFRRNAGLWLFPLMLGLAWETGREPNPDGVVLWADTSLQIGVALTVLGPISGGVAAWMAGRDRRRRIEDLLATTPRPAVARDLTGWTAAAGWGLLAYTLVGLYRGVDAAREATWGGPDATPILIGLVTVAASAALGYAAGSFVSSRFTAALVPIALFVAAVVPDFFPRTVEFRNGDQVYTEQVDSSLRVLSPWTFVNSGGNGVYEELKPEIGPLQMAWIGGLGGIALAVVALRRRRSAAAWGTLLASALLAVLGATMLLRTDRNDLYVAAAAPSRSPCVMRTIPVCVHPAYAAVLDETADLVDGLVRPLAGLPGMPVRAEQYWLNVLPDGRIPEDTLGLFVGSPEVRLDLEAAMLAWQLVNPHTYGGGPEEATVRPTEAQAAIALWLVRQAGYDPETEGTIAEGVSPAGNPFVQELLHFSENLPASADIRALEQRLAAAADRFAALDPAAQRAWLEAHFAALRAGELTLDDLP
jgi:hypothetical protein